MFDQYNLSCNVLVSIYIYRPILIFFLVVIVVQAEEFRRGTTKIALRMCHVFSVAFPMMPTFLK